MVLSNGIKALEGLRSVERVANDSRNPANSFGQILDSRKSREIHSLSASAGEMVQMCRDLASKNRLLDHIIEEARRGKKFSPQELLAIQAEIYRFVEEASLVSKAAEQAASGLHRLWQLQI